MKFKLLGIVLFMALCSHINAQVYYGYDGNGNRTQSSIIFIPIAVSPPNKDTTKPCITIYPNPTTGQVNVSIPCIQNCEEATIYTSDGTGNLLATQKATSTNTPLSLASYKQGIYYLRIQMCENQYNYKVIKTAPGNGNTNISAPPAKVKY